MNYVLLFGMPGGGELFVIVLVIIMLFGSKKIPELARGIGKGMREIKNATNEIQQEIREGAREINRIKEVTDIETQVKDVIDKEKNTEDTTKENTEAKNIADQPQPVQRKDPYNTEDQNPTENS